MQITESKGGEDGAPRLSIFFRCFWILVCNEKQMHGIKKRRRKRKPHKQQPIGGLQTLRVAGQTDSCESKGGLSADSSLALLNFFRYCFLFYVADSGLSVRLLDRSNSCPLPKPRYDNPTSPSDPGTIATTA